MHGLLDLTVDRVLEVVDEYHAKILELEHDTLIHPKMRVVRDLHILQGDLILHKCVAGWSVVGTLLTERVGARLSLSRLSFMACGGTTWTAA